MGGTPVKFHIEDAATSGNMQVEHASIGSLADRCEGRRMPELQARRLFAQLLDGLAYCHAQGVYHRDLKVEHILLSGRWFPVTS